MLIGSPTTHFYCPFSKDTFKINVHQVTATMNDWQFHVLLILFLSYQDNAGLLWRALCSEAPFKFGEYCSDPKFLDRKVWVNSVDHNQGLHCLSFHLHLLDALLYGNSILVKFYSIFLGCPNVRSFMVQPLDLKLGVLIVMLKSCWMLSLVEYLLLKVWE